MLNPKLQCPICNQEFPAYDQRGFRNAGFTSHHNRCLERHEQQQNVAHQRDKQSCRAVRFAMAIKRRLLPAQPVSPAPTNTAIESRTSNSTPLVLPESGPGSRSASSVSSLSPPTYDSYAHRVGRTAIITPIVPSQASSQPLQHHRAPRQRHTWNHWKTGKDVVRRSTNTFTMDMPRSLARSPPTHIPSSPSLTAVPSSAVAQTSRATATKVNDSTKISAFPWLTTITVMDSTTALIIPQATPTQPSHPQMSSPILDSSPPFSFMSMHTTLPLESTPIHRHSSVSVSSANSIGNLSNNLEHLAIPRQTIYSSTGNQHMDPMANDWMAVADSSGTKNDLSQHQQLKDPVAGDQMMAGDNSHALNDSFLGHPLYQSHARTDHHHLDQQPCTADNRAQQTCNPHVYSLSNHQRSMKTAPLNPSSTVPANPIHLPISTTQLPMVTYCSYCLAQNGLHDPSCSLLGFIMAEIMRGCNPPS